MKLGNEDYTYEEVDLMAVYEKMFDIHGKERVTAWWGDLAMYELENNAEPEKVRKRLEESLKAINMTREEFADFRYCYRLNLVDKIRENMPKRYEAVIIFNKPMLFTNERLEYKNIPDGLYRYDIRDGGMDGNMRKIKDKVGVNHFGTVLSRDTVEPRVIDGKEMNSKDGIIMTNDDYNYTGEKFTAQEYLDDYNYLETKYCEPEETQGMIMQ